MPVAVIFKALLLLNSIINIKTPSEVTGSFDSLFQEKRDMHIDAVVIGAIVSVVLTIVVIGVIGYRIMKNLDDK